MSDSGNHIRVVLARGDFRLEVDQALPGRGITAIYGASGSGKTTLLRCVAGLERAPGGLVRIGGDVWQDDSQALFLPPWDRSLGYVFQEASLFGHLDVRGNLEYGLKRAGARGNAASLEAAIELLGIGALLARRAHSLSGGERQRVAIARAVAAAPRLLLLDEPLASLDVPRRHEILPWLERLRDELALPMLYVTHAADEVARLADTLVVLERGRVSASGEVWDLLARIDVSGSFGDDAGALLQGVVDARDEPWSLMRVVFPGGVFWLRDTGAPLGQALRLRVLARDVSITTQEPHATSIQNVVPGVVETIAADAHPSQVLVRLRCGEAALLARITARAAHALALAPGQPVWAQVKSVALVG